MLITGCQWVKSTDGCSFAWCKRQGPSIVYVYDNCLGDIYRQTSNIRRTLISKQQICWSFRCNWIIACRRCSNYIFILDLTRGFKWLGKDNFRTRRETFKFWDLIRLILEVWRYSRGVSRGIYQLSASHVIISKNDQITCALRSIWRPLWWKLDV